MDPSKDLPFTRIIICGCNAKFLNEPDLKVHLNAVHKGEKEVQVRVQKTYTNNPLGIVSPKAVSPVQGTPGKPKVYGKTKIKECPAKNNLLKHALENNTNVQEKHTNVQEEHTNVQEEHTNVQEKRIKAPKNTPRQGKTSLDAYQEFLQVQNLVQDNKIPKQDKTSDHEKTVKNLKPQPKVFPVLIKKNAPMVIKENTPIAIKENVVINKKKPVNKNPIVINKSSIIPSPASQQLGHKIVVLKTGTNKFIVKNNPVLNIPVTQTVTKTTKVQNVHFATKKTNVQQKHLTLPAGSEASYSNYDVQASNTQINKVQVIQNGQSPKQNLQLNVRPRPNVQKSPAGTGTKPMYVLIGNPPSQIYKHVVFGDTINTEPNETYIQDDELIECEEVQDATEFIADTDYVYNNEDYNTHQDGNELVQEDNEVVLEDATAEDPLETASDIKQEPDEDETEHITPDVAVREIITGPNTITINGEVTHEFLYCELCGKTFDSQRYLRYHQTRYHKVTVGNHRLSTAADEEELIYKCTMCDNAFAKVKSLNMHMTIKHGVRREKVQEKTHGCTVCGRFFANKTLLTYHTRTHTGEKPYPCEYCPKRFINSALKALHVRTHTGERPYPCEQCDKRFIGQAALWRHRKIHSGEKAYACPECGKCFTQSNSMKLHVLTVHLKQPTPYKSQSRMARQERKVKKAMLLFAENALKEAAKKPKKGKAPASYQLQVDYADYE